MTFPRVLGIVVVFDWLCQSKTTSIPNIYVCMMNNLLWKYNLKVKSRDLYSIYVPFKEKEYFIIPEFIDDYVDVHDTYEEIIEFLLSNNFVLNSGKYVCGNISVKINLEKYLVILKPNKFEFTSNELTKFITNELSNYSYMYEK